MANGAFADESALFARVDAPYAGESAAHAEESATFAWANEPFA